jgi:hypothetical protein
VVTVVTGVTMNSGGSKLPTSGSPRVPAFVRQRDEYRLRRAAQRGLVAKWSRKFGYISLHDPTTGEWHDLAVKDAPDWAKWEASTRKRLWRSGHRDAFDLTSAQMLQIWDREHLSLEEEDGIVEEHELPDD